MDQNNKPIDFVIGLGETGRPLKEILEQTYPTMSRDIEPVKLSTRVGVLHICYPYQVGDFVSVTVGYIQEYQPELTIIHSTVVPGTTRKIYQRLEQSLVAYSPIRGKHSRMRQDLLSYTKFVAGTTPEAGEMALEHLQGSGFKARQITSCEALELAKPLETTYFGLLIAWAQEVERYSLEFGVEYSDLWALSEDVNYLPPVIFQPGFIGGHCVMPNIKLLEELHPSPFLDVIKESNERKKEQWLKEGKNLSERIAPKPFFGSSS